MIANNPPGVVSDVKSFLNLLNEISVGRKLVNGYSSMEGFLLRHGCSFTPQPLPKPFKRGTRKQCFRNSALLVMEHHGLVYCEGYAMGVIPVMHAWACDEEGNVVEVTWKDIIGTEYFGIPIRTTYLMNRLGIQKRYGLLDNPENGWPMLKDPPEKWKKELLR